MEMYNVKFKKKFGQNFLKDKRIVKRIVDISGVDTDSLVIEVGPGGAIMTKELALKAKKVLAYEIDSDLEEELSYKLEGIDNVDVLFQDFLTADIVNDVSCFKFNKLFFVSNVPYYITTPIILKLIKSSLHFENIVMMVQKEVGERFNANINSKDYSSITVFLNYYFDVKKEFIVSKNLFYPKPAIDSMIISLSQKNNRILAEDEELFLRLIRDSFRLKRKTLRNNLKEYDFSIIEKVLEKKNLPINVRGEQIPLEVFIEISNELKKK